MGNPFGRATIVPLTNKSGGSVAAGDLVYIDTANNDAFTTGTTSGYAKGIGIAQAAIASNAIGLVLIDGYASLVNVNASVTRGNFLKGYTVAKQGTDAGSSRGSGTCGMFLTGGTTPDAIIWQPDLGAGSGLSDPMTTRGDTIYRDSSNVTNRLALPAAGQVLGRSGSDLGAVYPPGYEYAYAAITADITTASDTAVDATGLTVTFTGDGSAVMVEFYSAEVQNSVVDKRTTMILHDTTAAVNIQLGVCNTGTATQGHPVNMRARVTAASGSQSYKVRWNRSDAAGTSTLRAGSTDPAFIRVTKV